MTFTRENFKELLKLYKEPATMSKLCIESNPSSLYRFEKTHFWPFVLTFCCGKGGPNPCLVVHVHVMCIMYMVIADYQPYHSQMARPNVLTNINTSAAMGKPVRTKSAFRSSPMAGSPPCALPDPQLTPTAMELAFGNDDICIMHKPTVSSTNDSLCY